MITTPTPGAPVPPDSWHRLQARLQHAADSPPLPPSWYNEGDVISWKTGWHAAIFFALQVCTEDAQAMQEREELAELLRETTRWLVDLQNSANLNDKAWTEMGCLIDRTRAAAERLRGGEQQ
jgi:hypothetical protein